MKIDRVQIPKSSFLSIEKDMAIIVDKIMESDRLQKLLYYTTPDALEKPKLTNEQKAEIFQNNIKIVPKVYVDNSLLNYIIVGFDDFMTNANNPEYRDNTIEFDIVCHFDQWNLGNYKLRPFRIAAEIDSMLNNTKLTGIGKLEFIGATKVVLTDEYAGVCLTYQAIHGDEDKKPMANDYDEEQLIEDFGKLMEMNK